MYLLNGAYNLTWIVGCIILYFVFGGIYNLIEWSEKRHEKKHPHKWNAWDQEEADKLKRQQEWEEMNKNRKRYY